MKNKIVKTLTLGISCLMLTLTISSGVLAHNSTSSFNFNNGIHVEENMPSLG